jgi:hypothetical protein
LRKRKSWRLSAEPSRASAPFSPYLSGPLKWSGTRCLTILLTVHAVNSGIYGLIRLEVRRAIYLALPSLPESVLFLISVWLASAGKLVILALQVVLVCNLTSAPTCFDLSRPIIVSALFLYKFKCGRITVSDQPSMAESRSISHHVARRQITISLQKYDPSIRYCRALGHGKRKFSLAMV